MRFTYTMALACLTVGCVMSVPLQEDASDISNEASRKSVTSSAEGTVYLKRGAAASLQRTKRNTEEENEIERSSEIEETDITAEDEIVDGLVETEATEQPAYPSSDAEEFSSEASIPDLSPEERSGVDPQTLKEMEDSGLMFNIIWRVQSGERDMIKLTEVLSRRFGFDPEPILRFSSAYISYIWRMMREEESKRENDREESDDEDDDDEGGGISLFSQMKRARQKFAGEVLRRMLDNQLDKDGGTGGSGSGDGEIDDGDN